MWNIKTPDIDGNKVEINHTLCNGTTWNTDTSNGQEIMAWIIKIMKKP